MDFGSVRFYRYLIIGIFCFLLLANIIWGIYGVIGKADLKLKVAEQNLRILGLQIQVDNLQPVKEAKPTINPSIYYQKLFPDLYASAPEAYNTTSKTIYLTFNGGPSAYTEYILADLARNDVKATFFVVGEQIGSYEEALQKIINEGHSLGILSYTKDYELIYDSVESYLTDFNKAFEQIYAVTGYKVKIFRFAGGSINSYNTHNYQMLIAEMLRRGFVYYDWNIAAGDASRLVTTECIKDNVLFDIESYDYGIVLMHETPTTLSVLPALIDQIKDKGFTLERLSNSLTPITFSYKY